MKKLKVYLDNCCFNRPYDEPISTKIKLEIESKLYIQEEIKKNNFDLVWSFILDFENEENPYFEIKESIKEWKFIAKEFIEPIEEIRILSNNLRDKYGFSSKDSLHLACSIKAKCDYFITTDIKLIKKALYLSNIKVLNPITFINLEDEND